MGRPILTTDANGCRGTVQDGVNGFLVPVGDAGALADKMEIFLKSPERIREMGRRSIERCREKFEVSGVNQKMMEIMGV